jgi:hypothetical protein
MKNMTLSGKKYKKVNIVQGSTKQISFCNAVQELLKWKEEMDGWKDLISDMVRNGATQTKQIKSILDIIESLESHQKEQDKEIQLLKDCVQELIRNEAKHLKNHTKVVED